MRKTFSGQTGFLWENLGFRVGMGGFFCVGGFLGAAVTCAGLVRDLSREFHLLVWGVLGCRDCI